MPYKITFEGLVQGVGFRPFLYRQAKKLGLRGYVQNTGRGVDLVIDKKITIARLLSGRPPMSRIDRAVIQTLAGKQKFKTFAIRPSSKKEGQNEIPPDIFLCPDCLKELRDPKNRRFGYFFITCTNCGPRYTVTRGTPYDRGKTSLKKFQLCPDCAREYRDPLNRRYHAETIACPKCGPKLKLWHQGRPVRAADPIQSAAKLIRSGRIVAVKGIGGFHLVCLAQPAVVKKLRELTGRPRKPYALMVKDIGQAKKLAHLTKEEAAILSSPQRPIVVARKRRPGAFRAVADLDSLGLMLPYTGLHYLLFDYLDQPLVFTSANRPDRPLTTRRQEQMVPDVLDHNRAILNPVDDSIIKVIDGHPLFLRKARGYVPEPIPDNSKTSAPLLALGAEQNSTFAVKTGGKILLSPHLGQTREPATIRHFQKTLDQWLDFYQLAPSALRGDRHPDYATAKYAISLVKKRKIPLTRVPHHLSHVLSVAAEHNLDEFIGIAADGAGYGDDGKIWGGEVFYIKRKPSLIYRRLASLEEQTLIGGDRATRDIPRLPLAILSHFMTESDLWRLMKRYYLRNEFNLLIGQLHRGLNTVPTTSTGRIFDAAAALLNLCRERTYEGEPALRLEAAARPTRQYFPPVIMPSPYGDTRRFILATTPLFRYLVANLKKDHRQLAMIVQNYLAAGFYQLARRAGPNLPVVFSGGVAYNRVITTYLIRRGVLINKKIPPGDGGISYGQLQFEA